MSGPSPQIDLQLTIDAARDLFRLVNRPSQIVNSLVESFSAELNQRLAAIREQGLFRELRRVDSAARPAHPNRRAGVDQFFLERLSRPGEPSRAQGGGYQSHREFRRWRWRLATNLRLARALSMNWRKPSLRSKERKPHSLFPPVTPLPSALSRRCLARRTLSSWTNSSTPRIVDAARLSGAKLRVFAHNDLNDLENILKWARRKSAPPCSRQSLMRRTYRLQVGSTFSSSLNPSSPWMVTTRR